MSRFTARERLGSVPALASPSLPRNTVLQGDCIRLMASLPGECADLVLTDPPYLCRYRDRMGRTVANDNNPHWLRPAFAEIYRVLKDDAFCISFYGFHEADRFLNAWREAGFRPAGHLVFAKDYPSSKRYLAHHHECAYLLAKGKPPLPRVPLPDVLRFPYSGNRLHPTQKPVSALMPLVEAFSPNNGLVLDPFGGSGSTLVAARDSGRDWLGIELDATHHATAMKRLL